MECPDSWCINLWSGPRSLSTSLMYSFSQRDDTEVLDEPLYAHFLQSTGAQRPYREMVLKAQDADGERVVRDVVYGPAKKKIRFVKHMAKQRTCLSQAVITRGRNVILIRDPVELIPSFDKVVPASLDETALPHLLLLWSELCQTGRPPPIVDATALRRNPEGVLRALCAALDLEFQPSMLRWKKGPRPEDGVWAPWWYARVHASTGFDSSPKQAAKAFSSHLYSLLEDAQPLYRCLLRYAIAPLPPAGTLLPPSAPALPDAKNERLLVWVGDHLVPRSEAKVSVFDSSVQGGDGVWEGLRVYEGRIFKLEEHLDRLMDSAKALAFSSVPSRDEVKEAITATLAANGMRHGVHIRLTLTRGPKVTSGMSPSQNQYGPLLIVLAEWKAPVYANADGIRLSTASTRRNSPQCVDSKIHHCNLINNILAKIEGNNSGMDDALMLDLNGFVCETNATNVVRPRRCRACLLAEAHTQAAATVAIMYSYGRVACSSWRSAAAWSHPVLTPACPASPAPWYCPLVSPANHFQCMGHPAPLAEQPSLVQVMELAAELGLPLQERNVSLSEFHCADEVLTSGTMGELTPVVELDGKTIGSGKPGPITRRLQAAYSLRTQSEGWSLPF